MIPDYEKNRYAIADTLLAAPRVTAALSAVRKPEVLKGTRDIWCRDFMPIQTDAGFVQFIYAPDYLVKKREDWTTITPVGQAYPEWLRDRTWVVPLVLDGGSVVGDRDILLVSERVLTDNPTWTRSRVVAALKRELSTRRVELVPPLEGDFTGHLDGSIRFVAEGLVIIGAPPKDAKGGHGPTLRSNRSYSAALKDLAQRLKLRVIELVDASHLAPAIPNDNVCGVYANFLQLGARLLLVPRYGLAEDELAIEQLESNGFEVATIDAREFMDKDQPMRAGGSINCITWSWSKDSPLRKGSL